MVGDLARRVHTYWAMMILKQYEGFSSENSWSAFNLKISRIYLDPLVPRARVLDTTSVL